MRFKQDKPIIFTNDDSLKQARIRSLQEGTSVNALLQEYLDSYSGARRAQQNAVVGKPPSSAMDKLPSFFFLLALLKHQS
jgi:hypothetical protein